MPYKQRDPWTMATRRFLNQASISKYTWAKYRRWLERSGEALGNPKPMAVTLPQLRQLEQSITGGEANKAVILSVTRAFLISSGCKAARDWKFPYRIRPSTNGVFLSELEVHAIRAVAASRGPFTSLVYSLAVDNGLRCVDMQRLTTANAAELLAKKRSTILGKGRGGGKPGHLELSRMTEKPLREYLRERDALASAVASDSPALLVSKHNGRLCPVSYDRIKDALKALSEEAGIPFLPHDLRRTFGHRHHLAGTPIETIAKLMRHENINQAFRCYIGIDSDEMREAQDKLCPK